MDFENRKENEIETWPKEIQEIIDEEVDLCLQEEKEKGSIYEHKTKEEYKAAVADVRNKRDKRREERAKKLEMILSKMMSDIIKIKTKIREIEGEIIRKVIEKLDEIKTKLQQKKIKEGFENQGFIINRGDRLNPKKWPPSKKKNN